VRSAEAGWTDAITLAALAAGVALLGFFVADQARSAQPIMPLRLLADRERAGAYAARFLFNGVLLSSFWFLTLGLLTTVFASAGLAGATAPELLAHRVGAAFAGATVLAALALLVTVLAARARPQRCDHAVAAIAR
jgi:hypothetical protein